MMVVVEVLLYVHKNRRLIRDGSPRTATSTFAPLLSFVVEVLLTSTETGGLLGTGAQDGHLDFHTAAELCQSGGGSVALSIDCLCHPHPPHWIVQELCESRGGRPGLSVLTSLLASVDVKLY